MKLRSLFSMFVAVLLCAIAYFVPLNAISIGSNTVVSRQPPIFYPNTDSDNTMQGFAAFERGFLLEDTTTTCTFSSFFPVSGHVVLAGARLNLVNDLVFSNSLRFDNASGTIRGNSLSVEFGKHPTDLSLPNIGSFGVFGIKQLSSVTASNTVNSVDWSPNGAYLATGANSTNPQLGIYSFTSNTLTLTTMNDGGTSGNIASQVNSVRWHPTLNYLGVCSNLGSTNKVQVFFKNPTGPFRLKSGQNSLTLNTVNATSCAWHPGGGYLVAGFVGTLTSPEVQAFPFNTSTGALSASTAGTSYNPTGNATISTNNGLSFAPGGNYLAMAIGTDVQVVSFSGAGAMALNSSGGLASTVTGVDWSPTGTYVAVGLSAGTDRLRIFSHSASGSTLTEVISARIGEPKTIQSVNWDKTGNYLVVGAATGAGSELRVYYFDKTAFTLTDVYQNATALASDVLAARWSRDARFIARGGGSATTAAVAFGVSTPPLRFEFAHVTFNNNVNLYIPIQFHGQCVLNGRGNKLALQSGSELVVRPGGTLILKNLDLQNVNGSNIRCMTDNSSITLQNSIISLSRDFTFSRGSLLFDQDVMITGTNKFSYTSQVTSTIGSQATLFLDLGLTFSYDPASYGLGLIQFIDRTSVMYLNSATFCVTTGGMQVTKGMIIVDGRSTLQVEALGLTVGSNYSASDCQFIFLPDAILQVNLGAFIYQNTDSTSWQMFGPLATLRMNANTLLQLDQTLNLDLGRLQLSSQADFIRGSTASIIGSIDNV